MQNQKKVNEYSRLFSKCYNELGWNYYPEYFGQQLLHWLQKEGLQVQNHLDLGCGTGVLCELLHQAGIATQGIDLSPDMIAIARQRNPEISYETADINVYRPDKSFDLITSTGDTMNHIHDQEAVQAIFCSVYDNLNADGIFLFDLLNEEEEVDDTPCAFDFTPEGESLLWHIRLQTIKTPLGMIELHIACEEEGGNAWEEIICEKLYPVEHILTMLQRAGFSQISCGDSLLSDGEGHGTSFYFLARK